MDFLGDIKSIQNKSPNGTGVGSFSKSQKVKCVLEVDLKRESSVD